MGSENRLGSVKPGPEIKSQTLPWVLPVQGGAPGATGTISVVWAVPRSIELRGMGGSPDKRVRQPGASVQVAWIASLGASLRGVGEPLCLLASLARFR